MMTKKDYECAAEIVRQAPQAEQSILMRGFRSLFHGDNHAFDGERFVKACFAAPKRFEPRT